MTKQSVTIEKTKVLSTDDRGWAINPIQTQQPLLSDIHIVNLKPGIIRGNHIHHKKTEYICVLGGKLTIAWKNQSGIAQQQDINADNESFFITIPPETAHACKNTGKTISYLVCYTNSTSQEKDTERSIILQ